MKKIFIGVLITIFILIASVVGFIAYLQHFAKNCAKPASDVGQLITIEQGESLRNVAKKLEESAIISNQHLFLILARYKGEHKKIKTGEYELSPQYTPEKILDILVKGKVKLHRITIPEGLNIQEIAAVVEKAGFGNRDSFIKLAKDREFIKLLGINNIDSVGIQKDGSTDIQINSLEGYLFPETYFFPAGTEQEKIITNMVERFNKVFIQDWKDICKQIGFTVHEIVTLASIIEKETANSAERSLISSVFHNRLKREMRLESDPTVIYGIDNFNGNITKKDLLTQTPYNTYAISGLPAGPIANPGRLSLQAAIFPQKSDFLFFVSKKDTTHQFSKTLKEHNMAVRKYQLNK